MPLENENNKSNAPPDQGQLGEQVKQLDEDLAALRARFDQFFLGLDKKNPQKDLDELRKRMLKLKREFVRNTGLKFRIQTLHAKFLSYERLWLKSLKEIEEGTYSRDLFKLRRKKGGREDKAAKKPAAADDDKKKEKKDSWSLEDLEADLPDELFGEPQMAAAAPPPAKPIARQKTDPALPDEVGGIGAGPRPQSPPPPPSGSVAATKPATPPPPPASAKPPPPPAAVAAGPIPRQPSKPPQAPAPMPRQPTNPPAPPPGAVAGAARPPAVARPPAPPPGATARPPVAPTAAATAARPPAPPAAAARPPPPPAGAAGPASGGEGLSQDKVKKIYDAFVTAKKRCKESTDGITLEAVEQSLRKQVPQLMKESGAKSVDFKVVIKDGKAVLKAVPK